MSRRHFTFRCKGKALGASLDAAPGTTALLIVSGGTEPRAGPWGSHAALGARIAAAGYPVLRFDRRGVGDSEGSDPGFAASGPDIAAALKALRAAAPQVERVVAYGNCDGASALMLSAGGGADALVLANPWTFEDAPLDSAEPAAKPQMTPQLLRAHYLRRLTDPRAIWRVLTGKVALGGLAASLGGAAKKGAPPTALAGEIAAGLAAFSGPATLLIAEADRTAAAFLTHWDKADPRLRRCPDAGHSFVEPAAREWLYAQLMAALTAL